MDREQLVLSLAALLSDRASALVTLKDLTGPGAYEAENAARKARQHEEWRAGGYRRWRGAMKRLKRDHYTECAQFLVEFGLEPECAGPVERSWWLNRIEFVDADGPPVPPVDVYEGEAA